MHTMSILHFPADAVSFGSWPIQFKILTLSITMCIEFLHQSNFCLGFGLNSVVDFSNTETRAPTSAERVLPLSVQRMMRFGYTVWISVMVIFRWLFFWGFFYLINKRHPYWWEAVFSWLNHLILAVDLWSSFAQHQVKRAVDLTLGSFALLHIHHVAFHGFWSFMCRVKKSPLKFVNFLK